MVAHLLDAAFEVDDGSDSDGYSPCEEPTVCSSPAAAIVVEPTVPEQTTSQQLPDGGEAAAPDLEVTPTKKRKRIKVGSSPEREGIQVPNRKGQKSPREMSA